MKVLLDSCVAGVVRSALVAAGHDVTAAIDWPRDPGDEEILSAARSEGRVLVTLDKDFGELAFRQKLPATSGIVLFRIEPASPSHIATVAVHALESRVDWVGHFSVVEETRIRMTLLP